MKIQSLLRIKINSQEASAKAPVGPSLGQAGVPIMDFCKKFNSLTEKFFKGIPLNVIIFSYGKQKYDFILRFPDFFYFVRCCLGLQKGSKFPGYSHDFFCIISPYLIYEITNFVKFHDPTKGYLSDLALYSKVLHSLRSMSIFCTLL